MRLLLIFVALVLVASACSSDSDDSASTDGASASTTVGDITDDGGGDEAADERAPSDDAEASDDGATDAPAATEGVLRVPQDHDTIQAAVDAAVDGDLVLIDAGVYNEAVVVETDNIVIRGVDRNEVVLDGQHDLENGIKVFSNGVAVENLTARNFTSNGVFFTGSYEDNIILNGYRASYVTVHNNGDYGIYAFNAENGLFEHSYGSGHPDSAFYIGQCQPCNAVITDGLAENNALGYSGTNAGGELYIINSEWRNNRIGIVPNSLNSEELAPQRDAVFAGNWMHNNGNEDTPRKGSDWDLGFGVGLVVAGGNNDLITKNLAENNVNGGIAIATFPDGDTFWQPNNNRVIDNVALGNPLDLVFFSLGENSGNCFEGNTFETSQPADIETNVPCDAPYVDISDQYTPPDPDSFNVIDYIDVPVPGPQENMPDALTAPAVPATDVFVAPDVDAITVPEGA
ncbi:MAG: right-handed parallel beta-helix repeat-containing protein [Acidimicrobiia bacterium]|nr:right-handed parallel beta-helix repeat-containing protein [Acidimicrobiia bacterium]